MEVMQASKIVAFSDPHFTPWTYNLPPEVQAIKSIAGSFVVNGISLPSPKPT